MKFSLAFLIAIALSGIVNIKASPVKISSELQDVLDEFLALLPVDKIKEIAEDYLDNDPQVQEAVEYLESPAFHQLLEEVEAIKEYRKFLAYLQESGLDVYGFLNKLHEILGMGPFIPSSLVESRISVGTGGIAGLIADIKAILPVDKIEALFDDKLKNSPAFANLIKRMSSPEFHEIVDTVLAKEEAQFIINKLKSYGVDVQAIADLLSKIFGFKFSKLPILDGPTDYDLVGDLNDFWNLLPVNDIVVTIVDFSLNDPGVKSVIEYVKSGECEDLFMNLMSINEFHSFVRYLYASGFSSENINEFIRFLELTKIVRPKVLERSIPDHRLDKFFEAIKALIPHEKIKEMYEQKIKTSKAFAYFVQRLDASEFHDITDRLVHTEVLKNLNLSAVNHGIDIKAFVELYLSIFGIEIHFGSLLSRSAGSTLNDDLQEFLKLVPVTKIREIVIRHYLFDREFRNAVAYVRSEEFHGLVRNLHKIPEYNEILNSLREEGLDVDTAIKTIDEFINFSKNSLSNHVNKARGIASFIAELKATLPADDIKALYQKKLETSKDFANLVALISSKKFQTVTNDLFADNTFVDMLHKLQAHGVKLQAVADFFLAVFGITTPSGIIA